MHSQRLAEPPRLLRSVAILTAGLCAVALLAGLPWLSRARLPEPPPAPKPVQEKERRIRVVRIPKPQPVRTETPQPKTAPAPPPKEPPRAAPRPPPAPRPAQQMQAAHPPEPTPAKVPERPVVQIAPDLTSVAGVRIRTFVRTSPEDLAAHLRNSGGCLVVGSIAPEGRDFVTTLRIEGSHAVETSEPMCSGAPKTLMDPTLNAALGDPLSRVRAEFGPGNYVLQAILAPSLYDHAHAVLVARFGPIAEEEMAVKAAQSGYEVKCYAEPTGLIHCE